LILEFKEEKNYSIYRCFIYDYGEVIKNKNIILKSEICQDVFDENTDLVEDVEKILEISLLIEEQRD
jgi:hypothetical protein